MRKRYHKNLTQLTVFDVAYLCADGIAHESYIVM